MDGDLKKYMETNENLKAQTAQVGTNPHNVATISYLGYVAPEGPGGKIYQAANISYADEAAPDLARFEEGLRASGNFIMCGSPGAGAESTDQHNVPEGHIYESSVPEGDAVQGLGPDSEYGTNPKKLSGITHLSGDTTNSENYKIPGRIMFATPATHSNRRQIYSALPSSITIRISMRTPARRRISATSSRAANRRLTTSGRP